jgi:hypothetical protein
MSQTVPTSPNPAPQSGVGCVPDALQGARERALRACVTATLVRGGALLTAGLVLSACGGSSSDSSSTGGGGAASMLVAEVSNGFGTLLPHTTFRVDPNTDLVTTEVIAIRSVDDILDNVRIDNPIQPPAAWDVDARLPSGSSGNHFVVARFTQPLDEDSIFDLAPASVASNFLSGTIQVVAYDPTTGLSELVPGRAFLGGRTPAENVQLSGNHDLEAWVGEDTNSDGRLEFLTPDGIGFPGTQDTFAGVETLVEEGVFVFVADTDDDLTTHETFPAGRQIRIEMNSGVRSVDGKFLSLEAVASATVGPDLLPPRVATRQVGADILPEITPGNGLEDVDPATTIEVAFTEPVQPAELGVFDQSDVNFELGTALEITFGPQDFETTVQYKVRVLSPYDLTRFEFIPAYPFPGTGPEARACDEYSRVDLRVADNALRDTSNNTNSVPASSFFVAGSGRVVTNAPIMPDAIYVGRANTVGISTIDLNGFGGGTGDPTFDAANPWKTGNSRFPLNPNVSVSNMVPRLSLGTCTFNGGGAGALTLTRNSALNTRLITTPQIENVTDMMVGFSLDVVFNNAPPPFGCQAGNPNLCASSGLKQPNAVVAGNTLAPAQPGQFSTIPAGSPNLISWAPHPNPPPLSFPPLCISPSIEALEPSSIDILPIPLGGFPTPTDSNGNPLPKVTNQLAPNGNPLGNPGLGIPPNGLFVTQQTAYFVGPAAPQSDISLCNPHMMRQQVGHFLYVADRLRGEIVVINSNRMTVLDRIKVVDPTNMAMSPNLDLLAVTNRVSNQVTFIDTDPTSTSFNQIIKVVTLAGSQPSAIVWQPDNEDILVCNQGDNTLSIIRAFDLEERKTVGGLPGRPVDLCVGARQVQGFGLSRNTYFAYILTDVGLVAVFESGPDGVGGWGPDSLIGSATQIFQSPRKIALDRTYLTGAGWIAHINPINTQTQIPIGTNEGAISQLRVTSAVTGEIPVTGQANLTSRQLDLDVFISLGEETISGTPVDIAFDCMLNIAGGLPNPTTQFSAPEVPAPVNGKGWHRVLPGPTFVPASTPTFMFVAVPNKGVVDVMRVQGGFQRIDVDVTTSGVQSIVADGALVLCDYWRQ